jgi:hypothetical protein
VQHDGGEECVEALFVLDLELSVHVEETVVVVEVLK